MSTGRRRGWGALLVALLLPVAPSAALAAPPPTGQNVDPGLLSLPEGEVVDFWVALRTQADLSTAPAEDDWTARGDLVVETLQDTAEVSQKGLVQLLQSRGIAHEPFWISNLVRVKGTGGLARELAARPEVERVLADRTYETPPPAQEPAVLPAAVEWNIDRIRAPEVWATLGTRGEGMVIANIDTGVQFDHPTLVNHYRGASAGVFDHNYNWFDPSRICGNPSLAPCDNSGHGTHTMGTMVGDDGDPGANRIGVAPGARWIAAKGCEYNSCSLTALMSSGEWVLAPTDLNGQNSRPDLRPNIVNNSWGGPGGDPFFQDIVGSWIASGMFPVFANGNSGPGCATSGAPGEYAGSYSVGAHDSAGAIAPFSSRGASPSGGTKPNISAPGAAVRSSVPPGAYATFSGTSMAAPHVAATVALMWSAAPSLVSHVALTRELLDQSAVDTVDLSCGGTPNANNVWGEGRLDAFAAVERSPRGPTGTLSVSVTDSESGAPVPGARIEATSTSGITRTGSTGGSGELSVTLPVGTYHLNVSAFGFAGADVELVIAEGATTDHEVGLVSEPTFAVSGTVADDGGAPIAGATVTVAGTPVPAAMTDANGDFGFPALPGGVYRFVVAGSDCFTGGEFDVVVDESETLGFTLARRTDGFGYFCDAVDVGYVDADTVLPLQSDDAATSVPLPFPFSFYGASYGTAHVSTNGFVSFTAPSTSYSETPIPHVSPPNAAIFAFWDDFNLTGDASQSVRTRLIGSEPDRRFVIEWRNVGFYGDTSRRVDVELVLHQNGTIETGYRNVADDARERGSSASIGLENAAGTGGFGYSFHRQSLGTPTFGLRFSTLATLTNIAPDASDDEASTTRNTAVTVAVLANDSDPDADALGVTAVSDPPHGATTVNPNGTVAYTPDLNFVGADSFTYDLADGRGGTDRAAVSMTVGGGGSPPAAQDDAVVTPEDTVAGIAVLANDSDPDGDALGVAAVSDPLHGTATVLPGNSVTYRPDDNFNGPDSFTYEARDPGGSADTATVSVTVNPVNDPPQAADDSLTTLEDTSADISVLANDSDADGDVLTVTAVSDPPHGVASVNPDGTVRFAPDSGFDGADSFTYQVSDGQGPPTTGTVGVTVEPVDDPAPLKTPQTALSVWSYPSAPVLQGVGQWMVPMNQPAASAGQLAPAYLYAHTFWFSDLRGTGTLTLGTAATRFASFTVTLPNGTVRHAEVPFPWAAGRAYFLYARHDFGGQWTAWVVDATTGAWTYIGSLSAAAGHQRVYPLGLTYAAWNGVAGSDCAAFPPAQVLLLPPTAFFGSQARSGVVSALTPTTADCPSVTQDGPGWTYYALGSP